MSRRILTDLAIGIVVQLLVTGVQFTAYLAAPLLGVPISYDTAPESPASAPGWFDQVNAMMLLSAPAVLVITLVLGLLLRVTDVNEGLVRGLNWTVVVAAAHALIGLGNGTLAMFAVYGIYVLLVAVWLGPILAGWWKARKGTPTG